MVLTGRVPELGKCNGSSPFPAFFHQSAIFYGKAPLQDVCLAKEDWTLERKLLRDFSKLETRRNIKMW